MTTSALHSPPDLSNRLPVTVVTGFLGAGKTTVLRRLLLDSGLRLAVLVNEFGEVGLDGELIASCGFCPEEELEGRLVELTNGCLCCTVQEEFLPTISRLLDRAERLDGIVVETSGLALPEPLIAAFGWPAIRTRTRVQGVIAVVDGEALAAGHVVGDLAALERQRREDPSLDHLEAIEDLFSDQLAAADLVLISRADLLDAQQLQAVEARLQPLLPRGTPTLTIAQGQIDPALLLGLGPASPLRSDGPDQATGPHHSHAPGPQHSHAPGPHHGDGDHALPHDHDSAHGDHHEHEHQHVAIHSFVVRRRGVIDHRTLERRLQQILESVPVLRLKGRLRLRDRRLPLQIQGVGRRLDCWFEAADEPGSVAGAGSAEEDLLELVVLGSARDATVLEQAFSTL